MKYERRIQSNHFVLNTFFFFFGRNFDLWFIGHIFWSIILVTFCFLLATDYNKESLGIACLERLYTSGPWWPDDLFMVHFILFGGIVWLWNQLTKHRRAYGRVGTRRTDSQPSHREESSWKTLKWEKLKTKIYD